VTKDRISSALRSFNLESLICVIAVCVMIRANLQV